jgi:hypothetical protein
VPVTAKDRGYEKGPEPTVAAALSAFAQGQFQVAHRYQPYGKNRRF